MRTTLILCLVAPLLSVAAPLQTLSVDGVRRYEEAVRLVQAGQYRESFVPLNALARDFPRVPEVFATRCSAQLGAGASAAAELDCRYALSLNPNLATALYALAVAQDNQGKGAAALATYRDYAARPDADPSLRANAQARVDALGSPRPLAVVPPPAPAGTPGADGRAPIPQVARGTIYIYRNHYFQNSDRQVTLLVDDQVVGDINHDQYVEVQLPAGEHVVEASIGGIRYRVRGGWPTLRVNSANGHFEAGLGTTGETSDRIRGITVPVEVTPNGQTYVKFDTSGRRIYLQVPAPSVGHEELVRDCKKAYTKKF